MKGLAPVVLQFDMKFPQLRSKLNDSISISSMTKETTKSALIYVHRAYNENILNFKLRVKLTDKSLLPIKFHNFISKAN